MINLLDEIEDVEAYRMGYRAYGVGQKRCPLAPSRHAVWWTGWYDARAEHKLGHIFERNRLQWPDRVFCYV